MVLKPSEVEEKATERKKIAFEKEVAELEAKIDEHLIYFADGITQNQETNCGIPYGVPEAVLLETVKKYEAAGWKVSYLRPGYSHNPILRFEPKYSEPRD